MMSKAVRIQREGILPDLEDPLVIALSKTLFTCCDEVGYEADVNTSDLLRPRCPVRVKCYRLWQQIGGKDGRGLTFAEYRQLSQKFYQLKQERDFLLGQRTQKGEGGP
jgi:hypothetical protein